MNGWDRVLVADRVTRRFGSFTAVEDVSIEVRPGEIVGLLGSNGAGKTTVIRMLLGLLPATEGAVAMFGEPPSRRARRRLGYVSQSLGLYRDMTVGENVAFQSSAFGVDADATALSPELAMMRDRLVGTIGLGRQRQLAFACALAHRPDALVLDEPTSGVDPLARARLWDEIRNEAGRGVGVLVTTHYMEEAQQCDRLVLMVGGQVAAVGTVGEIVAGREVVQVTADSWSRAFEVLGGAGFDVMLAGRQIRVATSDEAAVGRVLRDAGVSADVRVVPAILDEAMVALSVGG